MLRTLMRFLPMAEKIINRKSTLPILSQICVRDGFITATDLETTVRMKIESKDHYTIPLTLLKTVLKARPKRLDIARGEGEKITITYDNRRVTFTSLDTDEFPSTPPGKFKAVGIWSKEVLRKLYEQVACVSTDELKPALTGVYLHQNHKLSSCATDGHVLRWIKNMDPDGASKLKNDFQGIIPKKSLQLLTRIVKGNVKITERKPYLCLKLDKDTDLFIRLIDETYPNYKQVIPSEFSGVVTLNRDALRLLINDALHFISIETKTGVFTLNTGEMKISVNNPERKLQWNASLPITLQTGKAMTLGMNLHYLDKILKGIDAEEVSWEVTTPISASILTGVNGKVPDTIHLIMPVRVKESEETDGKHDY